MGVSRLSPLSVFTLRTLARLQVRIKVVYKSQRRVEMMASVRRRWTHYSPLRIKCANEIGFCIVPVARIIFRCHIIIMALRARFWCRERAPGKHVVALREIHPDCF